MLDEARTARLRATIEEELGSFRHFADVPASEIETMAERIVKAIGPYLAAKRAVEPA